MIQKLKQFLNNNNGLLGATYSFLKFKKYQYTNFKKHNYSVKNNDEKILSCVNDLIDTFITNNQELLWVDNEESDIRIMGAENISEKFLSLNIKEFTQNIGSTFLQQKLKLLMIMANKVSFKSNNKGSGGGWHKDSNAEQFKSLLYLSTVGKDNGPFQIVKNSNNDFINFKIFANLKKKFPAYRFTNEEINRIVKKKDIIDFTGDAGTLILFNTSMLHRGSPIKSGIRYAMTNYFYPEGKMEENLNKY